MAEPPVETPRPPPPSVQEVASDLVSLEVEYDRHVGLAWQVGNVPIVKGLRLGNLGPEPLDGLRLSLFTVPDLSPRLELPVARLAPHGGWRLDDVALPLSGARLARQEAREEGRLWIEVAREDAVLLRASRPLEVLPPDTWPGPGALPELLAAFVRPEDPEVVALLEAAAARLATDTGHAAFGGYEGHDPARVRRIAAAVYGVVGELGLCLVAPRPGTAVPQGVRVRTADEILCAKMATHLELALLFAAALEGTGLNALVVLLDGRALAGVWLEEEAFTDPAVDEVMRVRKRIGMESLLVFDPTGAAQRPRLPFEDAVREAARLVEEVRVADFLYALDVAAARRAGIRALPLPAPALPAAPEAREAPVPEEEAAPPPPAPLTRVERWKRRLLDLSLRNRLLNHRVTAQTIPLAATDAARLEDLLADGRALRLLPSVEPEQDPGEEARRRELDGGGLRTALADEELERRLVRIFRAARLSLQEGGANTLYLALGFLHWYETPTSETERLAPILLYPLVLTRRSVAEGSKGYRIELADDDPQINVTLLQKLEAEFDLCVQGLDELVEDESGLDVDVILERFRKAVAPLGRWRVEAEAAVGLFSFTKYLMWLDLDRRADVLTRNDVVRHLFETPEQPFAPDVVLPDPATFDATRAPTDTFVPMPSDSSQQRAVFAAADGHTFVLEGPPGTGKSQTITNLISHAVATGRRVLFVSEKIAALDVVHKRLSQVGLAPFCLELHSNKARKRSVLEQLRGALEVAGTPMPEAWPRAAESLSAVRGELNAHTGALHRPRAFGRSAFHGLARLIALRDAPRVRLALGDEDAVDREGLEIRRRRVRDAKVALAEVGDAREHPWRASNLAEWGPALPGRVEETAPRVAAAATALEEATAELAGDLGVDPVGLSRREVEALGEAAALLARSPAPTAALLGAPAFAPLRERIEGWVASGRVERGHRAALGVRWREDLLRLDLEDLRRRLASSRAAWWPVSWFRARGPKKRLRAVLREGTLPDTGALLQDLDPAIDWRRRREELEALDAEARALLGAHWSGLETDWDALAALVAWVADLRALVPHLAPRAKDGADAFATRLESLAATGRETFAPDAPAGRRRRAFDEARAAFEAAREEAAGAFALDPALAWGDEDEASFLARVRSAAEGWLASKTALRDWCAWVRSRRGLDEAGLGPLREAAEQGRVPVDDLEAAFEHSFFAWWIEAVFEADPVLRRFRGAEQNARIEEYRRLDEKVMETTKGVLLAKLAERLPSGRAAAATRSDSSEMGILHRELMKRRNMPIRRLFERIPNAVSRLKPCMLMSPLSVAQYLGPDFPPFDLVVFDEASQIPPWDAVGAIARGERLVVVGDSKQLPPTNFFQRSQEGDDLDDEDDLREMESILDECIAARLPRLHLGWHYRSRHESLIAFSNHQYYEDGLTTFPSAVDVSPRLGVKWHAVPDGVYDKGRSRTNRREAEALVAEVVRRLTDPAERERSLGVVTFSIAQASLVEDLLEAARREHPEIDPLFDEAREESVFVKNLENVQGDERDVIFLSVCYGPDAQGSVALNFGPLNREGGERRLNVAVTRAREQVVVFSTLRSEQIDLTRTQARGARDLKAFLEYAENGTSALGQALRLPDEVAAESTFEAAVATALGEAGWKVRPHVGCSAYRIDVGVEDPDEAGRFLAAVESDGVTYGRAVTARDRHATRPSVLRYLGWDHLRVWSTDWWQDPDGERKRLLGALEAARAERAASRAARDAEETPAPEAEPAAVPESAPPPEKETPLGIALGGRPYERADLGRRSTSPKSFYDERSDERIVRRIEKVVEVEAPVALGVIARRLADVWGLKNITTRLKDRVGSLIARAENWRFGQASSHFFWRRDQDPTTYEGFRVPAPGGKPARRARHIPPEEIANAAGRLLAEHLSIELDDLARETALLFGYRRVTEKVQAPMEAGVRLLVARGGAILEEGRVRLP